MKSLLDYKDSNTWLMHGDCLDRMKEIPDGSVDAVICDPPYGATQNKWDSVIPLDLMWTELKRVIKPNGAIVMTASQPFTSILTTSNLKMFRYCWVWEKTAATGHLNAKRMPMKSHEDVLVFYAKQSVYNPQGLVPFGKTVRRGSNGGCYGVSGTSNIQTFTNYPRTVLKFPSEGKTVHPTQKPVPLMEYLVKTYTNENNTVLDFTAGSFTTGVACMNLDRAFIGIEMDDKYFNIGKERILAAQINKQTNETEAA